MKKHNVTLAQQIEILDWQHKNDKNQPTTAWRFSALYPSLQIEQPLISSWLKDKAKWKEQLQQSNPQVTRQPSKVAKQNTQRFQK